MPASSRRARSGSDLIHSATRRGLRLVLTLCLTVTGCLVLGATTAPVALADTMVTPFASVDSTANDCTSVSITSIEPAAGVRYLRAPNTDALDFPVTLAYDSTGSVTLRAEADPGTTLSGPTSYTLRAPADCFPETGLDVETQSGTTATWCSADPDAAIAVDIDTDLIPDTESISWTLVPQSTDPQEPAVATGSLPDGQNMGGASIARPDGVDVGRYNLEFRLPGQTGFPAASLPVLLADCVSLDLSCGIATFSNPDSNADASVSVLPAGVGFPGARTLDVPSGEQASLDVSDLTEGFGWVATSTDGEIGSQALVEPSAGCLLSGTRPVITGEPALGRRLGVSTGEWQPEPVELSYRWYRDGRRIAGADGPTHRVGFADLGHRLRVRVTGHKDGYPDKSLTSASTRPVFFPRTFPRVHWRR